jgi:hypothetical protein
LKLGYNLLSLFQFLLKAKPYLGGWVVGGGVTFTEPVQAAGCAHGGCLKFAHSVPQSSLSK